MYQPEETKMSESITEELIRFIAALKLENRKITWDQVAELAQTQFPAAEGVSLTSNAIRKRYNSWLRQSEGSQRSDNSTVQGKIMPRGTKEHLPDDLLSDVENYIEEYVRPIIERVSAEMAERVFQEKFSHLPNVPTVLPSDAPSLPPAPPMPETIQGTRRHTMARGKLAGTVDAALLELFESERNVRGYNVSRMLDVVLWNYFSLGKSVRPRLSFEKEAPYSQSDT
jgi:hypothetical protein